MKEKYFQTTIALEIVLGITVENLAQYTGLSDTPANVESQLKTIVWSRCESYLVEREMEEKGSTVREAVESENYEHFLYNIRWKAPIVFAVDEDACLGIDAIVWIDNDN